MKKISKKIFGIVMAISLVTVCCITASATGSGYIKAPASTVDKFTNSNAYACYSESKTAPLSTTYTYFDEYKSLSTDFKSNNNRIVEIQLWEDDFVGNDHLKTYKGKFEGRTLYEINLTKTNWTDKYIEGEGDNAAELFIKYKVDSVDGDDTKSVSSGLFKFNVGIR